MAFNHNLPKYLIKSLRVYEKINLNMKDIRKFINKLN
jgi:hypothetical protein